MDTNKQRGHLVECLQRRVNTVEEAVTKLNSTRTSLQQNALEVKAEIQRVVSRLLETLRNREVWLLEQVDLIQTLKENTLSQQLEALSLALGSARNHLALGEDVTDEAAFCATLQDTLNRIDSLNLNPDESPHISLRGDVPSLKKAIQQFGKIDAKGLPLESAFVKHGSTSTSLPKEFEDYEDDEHHVLYKTVSGNSQVNVNIPRLDHQKWLVLPDNSSKISKQSRSAPPSTRSSLRGRPPSPTNVTQHVEQWMQQLKQFSEMEDDDITMLSPTCSESVFSSPVHKAAPTSQVDTMGYFEKIKSTPQESWLLNKKKVQVGNVSCSVSPEKLPYFTKLAATPSNQWLSTPGCTKVNNRPSNDISYFSEVPSDPGYWIAKAPSSTAVTSTVNSVSSTGKYTLAYFSSVSTTPTGNWLASRSFVPTPTPTPTVRVTAPQPAQAWTSEAPSEETKKWLMSKPTQVGKEPCQVQMDFSHHFQEMQQSPTQKWLVEASNQSSASARYTAMPVFQEILASPKTWVLSNEEMRVKKATSCCSGKCADVPSKVDIENLAAISCVREPKRSVSMETLESSGGVSKYFQDMKKSSSEVWLIKQSLKEQPSPKNKSENSDSMQKHFNSVKGANSENFLMKMSAGGEKDSLREDLREAMGSYFRSVRGSDAGKWLLDSQEKEKEVEEESLVGSLESEYVMPRLQDVCKANEMCNSFTECLSDERCCSAQVSPTKEAASPSATSMEYFSKVQSQDASQWLAQGRRAPCN